MPDATSSAAERPDPPSAVLLDPTQLRRTAQWGCSDIVFCIARTGDAERLIVGSSDFGIYQLDGASGEGLRTRFDGVGHSSYVTGVAVIGRLVISGGYDGQLIWWDLESQRQLRSVAAHDRWIRRLVASPDGRYLVSIADDMLCRVWDAESGRQLASFSDHAAMTPHHFPSMLYAVAISPNGQWVATGDRVGHVAIWSTDRWQQVAQLEVPLMYTWDPTARRHSIGGIRSLAFSADGSKLAVGGIGKIANIDHLGGPARLEIFDWRSGERLHALEDENRKGLIEQIVWLPQSSLLLTVGGDHKGFLTFYDADSGRLVHQDGNDGHIHGIACDPPCHTLYVAAHQRVEKWSLLPDGPQA